MRGAEADFLEESVPKLGRRNRPEPLLGTLVGHHVNCDHVKPDGAGDRVDGLDRRHVAWRLAAVTAGIVVGLTTPLVVLLGETDEPAIGNAAVIAYTVAAVVWARHTLTVSAPWWGRFPAAVLSVGLLIASSGFFLAIGAAVATVGAAGHGAVLLSRPDLGQRHLGAILTLTAVGVVTAAMLGDLTTEGGFAAAMAVFACGAAAATASLGVRPTLAPASPDPPTGEEVDDTATMNGSSH